MHRELSRLAAAFGAAFLLLAAWTGNWGLVRARELVDRPENPRPFVLERRGLRGAMFDRGGVPLVISEGESGRRVRRWLVPESGLVTGYSSALLGRTGLEAAMHPVLSGLADREPVAAWWEDLLRGGPYQGRDIRLTLDAAIQSEAAKALEGRVGAIVLVEIRSGDILAMASSPSFDPNRLEDDWPALSQDADAPLLNRATLGLYQPGGSLQPVLLAAAIRSGAVAPEAPAGDAATRIVVDGQEAYCAAPLIPGDSATLADVFLHGCPAPFAGLGEQLGLGAIETAFRDFGLYRAPDIVIPTASNAEPDPLTPTASRVDLAAIGQGRLTVSPLQMALVAAGIGNRGVIPAPRLLMAVELPSGEWQDMEPLGHAISATSPSAAEAVRELMSSLAGTTFGRTAGLARIPAAGHASTAISGPPGQQSAWFLGLAPTDRPRFAVAVLLESTDPLAAARAGARVLRASVLETNDE